MITPDIGSKCAVLLPQKFINPHITPAKGLVVGKFPGKKRVVLLEEVWQINTYFISCGWKEVPGILKEGRKTLAVPVYPESIYEPKHSILEEMIKKSVADFKRIYGLL